MPRRPSLRSVSTQLLNTKLRVPSPQVGAIARPRLMMRLNESVHFPLTLLSAPAGFGKTTLLAAWCVQAQMPVAWLALEASDDDAARFLLYVCAALQAVDAQLGAEAMPLLEAAALVPHALVLTTLLNGFAERTEPLALVLDDTHMLESKEVMALVGLLVEHCPPALHLLMATRADPDLPLARYRARGRLNEIRANDLRFTTEEAGEFLNEMMALNLTRGEVHALETRTEGWIAGLQLAAISLRERSDRAQFVAAFSGSHRFILDYLLEQVLTQQTAEIQSFLLRTCILERMNAALCDELTGQGNGQEHLEWLEAHNLFVVPLDEIRGWYRYHSLFAEVLQNRLRQMMPGQGAELHRRASAWFEQQGLYADAVRHARETDDLETIARIVEQVGISSALAGQPQMIGSWLNALPDEMIQARPMLACADAVVKLLGDQLEKSGARLMSAERGLTNAPSEQRALVQTWQAIWRGEVALHAGDFAGFVEASREGLKAAAPDNLSRLPLLVRVARAFQGTGDVTPAAEEAMAATVTLARDANNLFTRLNSIVYLARLQTYQGHLRQARATFDEAAQAMPSTQGQALPVIHPVYYAGLADLFREWNELERAAELLRQGWVLTTTTLSIDADAMLLTCTTQIRVQVARAEMEGAAETLARLVEVGRGRRFVPVMMRQIESLNAFVNLARGDLDGAMRWAQAIAWTATEPPDFLREPELVTWARVLLAHAAREHDLTRLAEVMRVLERWCDDAERKMRNNSVIELLVLRARAADASGRREQASGLLERALEMGEREHYVRVFADEGAPMRRLMLALTSRGTRVSADYVSSILAALGDKDKPHVAGLNRSDAAARELLSAREMQVLNLIVRGASNQEIAEALVIALPTVKRHISTIYDKLEVTSRTQAVMRAQALRLV